MKKIKFILSILLASILLVSSSIGSNLLGSRNTVEAANTKKVKALFFVIDEKKYLSEFPCLSNDPNAYRLVGEGEINFSEMIINNPDAVKKTIVKQPANYNWNHVITAGGLYLVAAPLTKDNDASSAKAAKAFTAKIATSKTCTVKKPKKHKLTRKQILAVNSSTYPSIDSVVWDSFRIGKKDVNDGVIPMTLINDEIYKSMNLPSECRSDFMIDAWRDNGHILSDTSNPRGTHILAIGAFYQTSGIKLPTKMTLNLGKIKTFGFNKTTQHWEIITSDPYPRAAKIYTLPWTSAKIFDVPCTKKKDHLSVSVTSADLTGNALHFWGSRVKFDKKKYLYYATAYTFWAEGNNFKKGSITATNAIDLKTSSGSETICQLISSRGMAMSCSPRTIWSTTIPNSKYKAEWGKELQALFAK